MWNWNGSGSCSLVKSKNNNGVDDVVVTVFWADSFETQAGGGTINSTHLDAFQEKT